MQETGHGPGEGFSVNLGWRTGGMGGEPQSPCLYCQVFIMLQCGSTWLNMHEGRQGREG